jgi:hypothetical protein
VWRGDSRRVRITTSMQILWDQILVAAPAATPLLPQPVPLLKAELGERGFSAASDAAQPLDYDFAQVSQISPWKQAPGHYTRLGDVRELLAAADDLFVVSKPGDALSLSFDARALPPLAPGHTRTFLLHGDGFSKELDINSSSPDGVLPFPYHGMPGYPFDPAAAPARVRAQAARAALWNTRIVAQPLPALELAAATRR